MDDSEPFAVTYALSLDDQVRGSRILFNRRWSIRLFYACLGLFWILAVGLALLLLFNGETGRLEGLIPGLVMPLVLMGLVYGLPALAVRRERKDLPIHEGPRTWTFSRQGLAFQSPGSTASVEWNLIRSAFETREFFFFCPTRSYAYLLPKRALSAEQIAHVRAFGRDYLGERAKLDPPES